MYNGEFDNMMEGYDQEMGYNNMYGYDQMMNRDPMTGLPLNYHGPKDNYYFTLDFGTMMNLGFTQEELTLLQNVVDVYGMVSTQKLSTPPFFVNDQREIARLMYAYNICMGKKTIDTDDPISISKHFKKLVQLSGGYNNFNALQVKRRQFNIVPRTAIVFNLPVGSFYVLNSKIYDKMNATYKVIKIAQEWITIQSTRRMAVTHEDRLNNSVENREWGIDKVLRVVETGSRSENKPWIIAIHKSHCRLCNRFIVMVSTKKFTQGITEHHGGYEVVLSDGTFLTVYAKTTDVDSYGNPKESIPNPNNNTVAADYGFYSNEIEPKINNVMNNLNNQYGIVYSKKLDGALPFREISEYSGMEQIRRENETAENDSDTFDNGDKTIDLTDIEFE